MPRIDYPFAAVPNQIFRSGVGAIRIAVFGAILSRGVCKAGAARIAKDIGCDKKSVYEAIGFWIENGEKYGITFNVSKRHGFPSEITIKIEYMTSPENGSGTEGGLPENGSGGYPKTGEGGYPKTGDKEEYYKKITEEEEGKTIKALDQLRERLGKGGLTKKKR